MRIITEDQRNLNQDLIQLEANLAPPTLGDRIVFKWDSNSNSFMTNFYSPGMTKNQIHYTDIQRMINKLRNTNYYETEKNWDFCTIGTIIIFSLIGFIILFNYFVKSKISMSYFPITLLGYFFVVLCLGYCCYKQAQTRYKRNLWIREEIFREIANEENFNGLGMRGWYWRIGSFGAWLALEKNLERGNFGAREAIDPLIPIEDQVDNVNYPSPPKINN